MAKLDRLHIGQEGVTFSAEPKSITYEDAKIVANSNDIRIEQNGFKSVEFVDTQYAGKDKIVQNGFSAFKLVPTVGGGSFKKDFDDMFDDSIGSVVEDLEKINDEANSIKDTVLSLSKNLTQNYLSKVEAYSPSGFQTIASGIKESTATFVTNEQAGQWYGLELETSADGKKYVTGFDMGAVVNPGQNSSDSYFRINADRFIVGGDIGDGNFSNDVPAFSIVQNDYSTPRLRFNGLVEFSNVNGAPSTPTSYIQDTMPYINLKVGDTWINTAKGNELSTYDGTKWVTTSSGGKTTPGDFPPLSPSIGDVWIDTTDNRNITKVWDGTTWKLYIPDIGYMVNNDPNVTLINGGKIQTGSITANQIATNTITANKIASYNLTASNATIGALVVDTISVVGEAITATRGSSLASRYRLPSTAQWVRPLSIGLSVPSGSVTISASLLFWGSAARESVGVYLAAEYGNTSTVLWGFSGRGDATIPMHATKMVPLAFSATFTPPYNTYVNYVLNVKTFVGDNVSIEEGNLIVTGHKK